MKKQHIALLALALVLALLAGGFALWRFQKHSVQELLQPDSGLTRSFATATQTGWKDGGFVHTIHRFDSQDPALMAQLWDILNSTQLQNHRQNLFPKDGGFSTNSADCTIAMTLLWGTAPEDSVSISVMGSQYLTLYAKGVVRYYHITDPDFSARLLQFVTDNGTLQE